MAQRDRERSTDARSGSGTLAEYSLAQARRAAGTGDFAGALDWLSAAGDLKGAAKDLECEVRYGFGGQLIAGGEYAAAEDQFSKGGACRGAVATLMQERLTLLRRRRFATQDLNELRQRFGVGCGKCAGSNDLYTMATCGHQVAPVPRAQKVYPTQLAPAIVGVYAAAAYRDGWDLDRNHPLSLLIRREKERIDPVAMRLMGALLASFVTGQTPLGVVVEAVVPVPTSFEREERRGGGLPYALAETLRDILALPLHELIVQVDQHTDHTQAKGSERRKSLLSAWRAKPVGILQGRSVLLVDDILTTGLTMSTAGELLMSAGVGRVYGLSLLHTERSS